MRELSLPSADVRCHVAGEGPPLIFLHGVLSNANLWRRVVPLLAGRFRCVTLDLPLGAHSVPVPLADRTPPGIARLVAEAIGALGLGRATLVGNDTGGAIAQLVAVDFPDLLDGLVLTSCEFGDNCPPRPFRIMNPLARIPGGLLLYLAPGQLPGFQRLPVAYGWLAKRPIEPRVAATYSRPAVLCGAIRSDLAAFLRDYGNRHTIAAAARLDGFDKPALIAWSADDRVFPPEHARALQSRLPRASLAWIEDSYAYSPEDQPEQLAVAIGGFVAN